MASFKGKKGEKKKKDKGRKEREILYQNKIRES
jgi:hypothetical protein